MGHTRHFALSWILLITLSCGQSNSPVERAKRSSSEPNQDTKRSDPDAKESSQNPKKPNQNTKDSNQEPKVPPSSNNTTLKIVSFPTNDASISRGSPSSNYGSSPTLQISTRTRNEYESLLLFDIVGITGRRIRSARLLLQSQVPPIKKADIFKLLSAFDENTVTFANAPEAGEKLGTLRSVTGEQNWVELDVTGLTQDGPYGFRIKSRSFYLSKYSSKEAGEQGRPRLEIEIDSKSDQEVGVPSPPKNITYCKDIRPIMNGKCIVCHSSGLKSGDVALDTHPDVSRSAAQLLSAVQAGRMPKGMPRLPQSEIDLIDRWIQSGKEDCSVDPVVCGTETSEISPSRIWRLSHSQYNNTIRDLFQNTSSPADSFVPDASSIGFNNSAADNYVPHRLAEQYEVAAQTVANSALSNISGLVGCNLADETCVKNFIRSFGRRAFRTPLFPEQEQLYFELYTKGALISSSEGIRYVLEAMLQSPSFLYRKELGSNSGGVFKLDSFAIAEQLSYMLWDTMPDNTLTINADQNKLSNPSEVSSQVDRMLQDSRAKQMTANYILQYFGLENVPHLEKDGSMFPEFNDNLKKYLTAETIAFANHVIWHGTGSFKELLTANYSFINEPLGAIYGVDGLRGSTLVKTNLNSTQRSGILTQSSFLASLGHPTYGSPTFRGVFIKERLLCQPVPQPPPDVADDITAPSAFITTRERYEVHTRKTSCMECHQRMDPIGFTFEKYDSLGKFRTVENGKVVNSSATVRLTGDTDASYEDAIGLIQSLSKSPQVSDCAATNYFRYSLGRLETPSDACELNSIREKFSTSNQNILQLIRDVVSSHAFFYRRKE